MIRPILALALLLPAGSAQAQPASATPAAPPSAQAGQTPEDPYRALVLGTAGRAIGEITLRGGESALVLRVEIGPGGLQPGWHGLRFHAAGDCSDPPRFTLAGAPLNHSDARHGLLNPEGPLEGNLPNLFAGLDGSARAEIAVSLIGLRARDQEPGLLDADGSALMIHAGEDDHRAEPAGAAAERVACAVIR